MVYGKEEGLSTPFNMALATLERINNILKEIAFASVEFPEYILRCEIKRKLTIQLYQSSVPLINDKEEKKRLKKLVKELSSYFFTTRNQITKEIKLSCQAETESKIDDVIEEIQEVLQKEKYFMPSKTDLP